MIEANNLNVQISKKFLNDEGLKIFWNEIKSYIDMKNDPLAIDGGELSTASETGIIYDGGYLETNNNIESDDYLPVTLLASDWIGESAPYEQRIPISDATRYDDYLVVSTLTGYESTAIADEYNKNLNCIVGGESENGFVTLISNSKLSQNIDIGLKKV